MPQTAGFQKFQFSLYDRVAECALDKTELEVIQWLKQAWDPAVSYEKLGIILAKWSGINRKLVVALNPLLSGAFGRSVMEEEQESVLNDKPRLTSLQILRRVQAHLQTNPEMREVYGLQDLMAVKWLGDGAKGTFKHNWTTKALNLHKTVSSKVQTAFLLERMAESADMATQVTLHKARFRGHEAKDESHQETQVRYDDLMGILSDAIKEERRDKNRQSELKHQAKQSKGGEQQEPPAAPGTKGEPKGKGKAKGKEKGAAKGDPKGKGKGKEKGKLDTTCLKTDDGRRICVFHQVGQCTKGADCPYAHDMCKTAEQKTAAHKVREMIAAARARSQQPTPAAPATAAEAGDEQKPPRRARSRRRSKSARAKAAADDA